MERPSVENALKVRAFLVNELIWADDATLTLNPGAGLPPDASLEVEVGVAARARNGLALPEPVTLAYRTPGYLRLTQSLPEPGSRDVDPASAVVASFDHPVVALGADPASQPPAFQLEPAAAGRGEWLNTSTYIFYPEPALDGGKTYTVQVDPTLHGLDGNPLEETPPWSFTTALPRLEAFTTSSGELPLALDGGFTLKFNQSMDPASVAASLRVLDGQGNPVPGELTWDERNTSVAWKPADLLRRAARYRVELDAAAQALGGTPLGQRFQGRFTTVPELGVVRTWPAPGSVLENYGGVRVVFSGPLDAQGLNELVTLEPRPSGQNVYWDQASRTLYINGFFQPSTAYRLSLSPQISDPWGSQLGGAAGEAYELQFRSAPLPPGVVLGSGSEFHFLTSADTALAAQVSGMSSIPLSLGSVPLSDLFSMVGNDSYTFRQNYRPRDQRSWRQELSGDPDQAQPAAIFLTPDGQPLPSGVYLLRVSIPGSNARQEAHLVTVSDVHATLKLSATEALVWAVDLQTNAPLSGAPVTVYENDGQVLTSGVTDSQGIFRGQFAPRPEPYQPALAVIGQPGEGNFTLTISFWSQDIEPWAFDIPADFDGPRRKAYLYTDRPIYRPGQTVYFRAVVREAYNGRYTIPDLPPLKVQFFDDSGQELQALELPLSAYGTINGEFNLPEGLRPGSYSIAIPDLDYSSISVPVADYRKPEIDLQVNFDQEQVLAGEALSATVDARYFFDAPAGNVPVTWNLYAAPADYDLPGYTVGLHGAGQWYQPRQGYFGSFVDQGEGLTGADGKLSLALGETRLEDSRLRYTLEATATDESGLPVTARAQILSNPADYVIGIRSDSWIGRAGDPLGFDVLSADLQGAPVGNKALRAEFARVSWVEDDSAPSDSFFGTAYKPEFALEASTDFRTGADGRARLEFTPAEPGPYQLSIFAPGGGGARSELLVWVGGPGTFVLPEQYNRHLELAADKESYQPGETARVFVPNPFSDAVSALVTLERGTILSEQALTLTPGGNTLEFPLTAEHAPNTYVSVTLLGGDEQGRPDFRQGYLNLAVAPVAQTLNVEIIPDKEVSGPGEAVNFDIVVRDVDGKPVQGEFSLAVVDKAALALADPNSLAILPAYYNEQYLGVRTGVPLSVYAARKVERPFEGGRGGGGGDSAVLVREKFPDTAFWQADIVTDAEGRARVGLALPDSLTAWQAETRGVDMETRVGGAQSEVVTTKDLIVRPVTPRFLVAGDRVELAAIVQNNTEQTLQGEAGLQAEGFTLDEASAVRQPFTLEPGGRARVAWWGTVEDVEAVKLVFLARTEDGAYQDAAAPVLGDLPVLRYLAPQTYRTAGTLDEGGQRFELVSLPRDTVTTGTRPGGGELEVELAPSLGAAMLKALEVLEGMECRCTELTLSRFLPNLELYRSFQQFGLGSDELQARLERNLDEDLLTLINRQNYDGGWGWWEGGESDALMTAYVLFGLGQARAAGVLSAEPPIQRAVEYLNNNVMNQPLSQETWQLDRRALAHYALANVDAWQVEGMNSLYAERAKLSPWGQALLALALERSQPGSEEARTLISDLESTAVRTAAGASWELEDGGGANMASTLTNSAIVTYALAQRDPGAPLVAEAVRYLVANRQADGGWTSSYTTAWTLMALNEVMKATGELGGDFSFGAALNDSPIATGQAAGVEQLIPVRTSLPVDKLYPDSPNLLTIERGDGSGRLYYSAVLNVSQPVEEAQPLSRGLTVSRQYFPATAECEGGGCAALTEAQRNEKVKVRLALTVPRDSYYVMVEDYIPAGAEILDTRLKTSQQGEDYGAEAKPLYDPQNPFANGWGWWYFNEASISDDHISWSAEYLPAGTYELTYTFVPLQAGEYQVLPGRAWQLYFPEVQATSAGGKFVIR
jgi:hypothetical protein